MYTQCPQCFSIYRVTPVSLQQSHGKFRCGRCGTVFDALPSLTEHLPEPQNAQPDAWAGHGAAQAFDAGELELPRAHEPHLPAVLSAPVQANTPRENGWMNGPEAAHSDEFLSFSALDTGETPAEPADWLAFSPGDAAPRPTAKPGIASQQHDSIDWASLSDQLKTDSLASTDQSEADAKPLTAPGSEPNADPPAGEDLPQREQRYRRAGPQLAQSRESGTEGKSRESGTANKSRESGTANKSRESGTANKSDPAAFVPAKYEARPLAPPPSAKSAPKLSAQRNSDTPARPAAAASQPSRALWLSLSLLLVCALLAQFAWFQRRALLAHSDSRPWLESACRWFACSLPLQENLDQFVLVDRDVKPHPRVKGALLISASLKNDAAFAQNYPIVEVRLSNVARQAVALRRFAPISYLRDSTAIEQGISAQASLPIVFEVLDPGPDAMNFEFNFLTGPLLADPQTETDAASSP